MKGHILLSLPHEQWQSRNAVKSRKCILERTTKDRADAYLVGAPLPKLARSRPWDKPGSRLMSRRTKTLLSTTPTLLQPKVAENQHKKLQSTSHATYLYLKGWGWGVNKSRAQQTSSNCWKQLSNPKYDQGSTKSSRRTERSFVETVSFSGNYPKSSSLLTKVTWVTVSLRTRTTADGSPTRKLGG